METRPAPVIWLTGLSAAGKTTLAEVLCAQLRALGMDVKWLDGDRVRAGLSRDLGFSRQDRDENVRRLGRCAALLARRGYPVVVSAVSPSREARDGVRVRVAEFVEVHVTAPLDVCEQRDQKMLYTRARAGEIRDVAGIDLPYEAPNRAEVECRTDLESVAESAAKVLRLLEARGYLSHVPRSRPSRLAS